MHPIRGVRFVRREFSPRCSCSEMYLEKRKTRAGTRAANLGPATFSSLRPGALLGSGSPTKEKNR